MSNYRSVLYTKAELTKGRKGTWKFTSNLSLHNKKIGSITINDVFNKFEKKAKVKITNKSKLTSLKKLSQNADIEMKGKDEFELIEAYLTALGINKALNMATDRGIELPLNESSNDKVEECYSPCLIEITDEIHKNSKFKVKGGVLKGQMCLDL